MGLEQKHLSKEKNVPGHNQLFTDGCDYTFHPFINRELEGASFYSHAYPLVALKKRSVRNTPPM